MKDDTLTIGENLYNEMVNAEDLDLADKLHAFISDAISRIALARRVLNDDETTELSYFEQDAIKTAINECYSLLAMANKFYFDFEGKKQKKRF